MPAARVFVPYARLVEIRIRLFLVRDSPAAPAKKSMITMSLSIDLTGGNRFPTCTEKRPPPIARVVS
jgi:hypothetical protein